MINMRDPKPHDRRVTVRESLAVVLGPHAQPRRSLPYEPAGIASSGSGTRPQVSGERQLAPDFLVIYPAPELEPLLAAGRGVEVLGPALDR